MFPNYAIFIISLFVAMETGVLQKHFEDNFFLRPTLQFGLKTLTMQ